MLERSRGLTPAALTAIADLDARTVAADGGRLKLEYGTLRSRPSGETNDLLWWDGDRLVGFLGVYSFGVPTVEFAGMVDPAFRRRGIATSLVDAALPVATERGWTEVLLVTPRNDAGGAQFARIRGAELEHSEHALVLHGDPADGPGDPHVTTRIATPADVDDLNRILTAAFGRAFSGRVGELRRDGARTVVIERDGTVVGTLRVTHDGDVGGIHGFAVDDEWRGRGIGRDVLRRICRELRADGAALVGLEVAVDNEHALGLYASIGFTPVTTEDYYALPR